MNTVVLFVNYKMNAAINSLHNYDSLLNENKHFKTSEPKKIPEKKAKKKKNATGF